MSVKINASYKALLIAGSLLFGACGGGGGSSTTPAPPPPPPPPPPPSNVAPVLNITTTPTNQSVDERQDFTIDATGSTDADGDTISYSITQTSGTTQTVTETSTGVFTFTAPEVTADETVTFDVTASDGTLSDTSSLTVTISNIALTPANTTLLTFSQNIQVDATNLRGFRTGRVDVVDTSEPISIFGIGRLPNGETAQLFLEANSDGSFDPLTSTILSGVSDNGPILPRTALLTATDTLLDIIYAFENDNSVKVVIAQNTVPFSFVPLLSTISVPAPCGLDTLFYRAALGLDTAPFDDDIVLASRDGGVSMASPIFSDATDIIYDVTEVIPASAGVFCGLENINLAGFSVPPDQKESATLIGTDFLTGILTVFQLDDTNTYVATDQLALENIPDGASVIDGDRTSVLVPTPDPFPVIEYYYLTVTSDNEHNGQHTIHIAREGATDRSAFEILDTVTWPTGTYKRVYAFDADRDTDLDIFVLLESAPFIVYFEGLEEDTNGDTIFADPSYIEIGFDVSELLFYGTFPTDIFAGVVFEDLQIDTYQINITPPTTVSEKSQFGPDIIGIE